MVHLHRGVVLSAPTLRRGHALHLHLVRRLVLLCRGAGLPRVPVMCRLAGLARVRVGVGVPGVGVRVHAVRGGG